MRHTLLLALVAAAAASSIVPRAAHGQPTTPPPSPEAERDAGPIRSGVTYVGAFFNFLWDDDVKQTANGLKTGDTEVSTGADVTVGHMVSDHWGLQIHAGASRDDTKTYTQDIDSNNVTLENVDREIFVAPALRYYARVADETYLFAALRAQIGLGWVNNEFFDAKQTSVLSADYHQVMGTLNLSPGVSTFLSRHLAAEALLGVLGYTFVRGSNDRGFTVHRNTAQFLFYKTSLNIGLVWYFDP